jgi:hypothetical protein
MQHGCCCRKLLLQEANGWVASTGAEFPSRVKGEATCEAACQGVHGVQLQAYVNKHNQPKGMAVFSLGSTTKCGIGSIAIEHMRPDNSILQRQLRYACKHRSTSKQQKKHWLLPMHTTHPATHPHVAVLSTTILHKRSTYRQAAKTACPAESTPLSHKQTHTHTNKQRSEQPEGDLAMLRPSARVSYNHTLGP